MNDYLMHSMMRAQLESKIASVARATTAAGAHVAASVDRLEATMKDGMVRVRTDMLEGFGDVRASVENAAQRTEAGFHLLDVRAKETLHAVRDLGLTAEVISENIVTGFTLVLDRLDNVAAELSEIKRVVMSPEETMALERGRTARVLASKGSPKDALAYVTAAIDNPNGMPMRHVPTLRALRGLLLAGAYDTPSESVQDLAGARVEFQDALRFAEGDARTLVQDQFATVLFGMGDFPAALAVYEDLSARPDGQVADLNRARCLLMMGQEDAGFQMLLDALKRDRKLALAMATDPVCQDKAALVTRALSANREAARRTVRDILRQAESGDGVKERAVRIVTAVKGVFAQPKLVCETSTAVAEFIKTAPTRSPCGQASLKYSASYSSASNKSVADFLARLNARLAEIVQMADAAKVGEMRIREMEPKTADWDEIHAAAAWAHRDLRARCDVNQKLVNMVRVIVDESRSGVLAYAPPAKVGIYATLDPEIAESLKQKRPTGLFAFRAKAEYDRTAERRHIADGGRVWGAEKDLAERLSYLTKEVSATLNAEMQAVFDLARESLPKILEDVSARCSADGAACAALANFLEDNGFWKRTPAPTPKARFKAASGPTM